MGYRPGNSRCIRVERPRRIEVFDVRSESFDRFTNNVGFEFTYQYLDSPDGRLTLQVTEYRAGPRAGRQMRVIGCGR
jgi:hypothetical protein